jgi:hypothetical protein
MTDDDTLCAHILIKQNIPAVSAGKPKIGLPLTPPSPCQLQKRFDIGVFTFLYLGGG